jgi:rubredoxin
MSRQITLTEMQERLDMRYPDKFKIHKFNGVKNKDCLVYCVLGHHTFDDIRLQDLEKHGKCPICNNSSVKKKKNLHKIKEEIELLTNNEFIYESGYINNQSKLTLIHRKCGSKIFNFTFNRLSGKISCPICETSKKLNIFSVKADLEAIDPMYEVTATEYNGTHIPLEIKHLKCSNTYLVSRTNFKSGRRCPHCTKTGKISKGYVQIRNILNGLNIYLRKNFYKF